MHKEKLLIVGEGVVGAYLAIQLSRLNFDVVWCKAQSDHGTAQRIVMLNDRSVKLLSSLDISVSDHGYAVEKVKVKDLESTGNFSIAAADHHLKNLGICIDEQFLYQNLAGMAPELKPYEEYQHVINNPEDAQFDMVFATKFINNSKVFPAISPTQYLLLMHVSYRHNPSNHHTARQFFTKYGPMGLLPYQAEAETEKMMVIWSFNDEQKATEMISDGLALQEFSQYTKLPLEALSLEKTFDIHTVKFKRFMHFSSKICLLSNAAYQTHPLAGQGLNLSLADAQQILDSLNKGETLQNIKPQLLRARFLDRLFLVFGAELVLLNFTTHQPLLRWLRARIMGAVNFVPQVKNILVSLANGK